MALSEFTRKLVETKLGRYCQDKVPAEVRNKLRVGFKIRGNNVTLFEERPAYFDPDEWVTIPVAQLRYDEQKNMWTLYCADRNSRWHRYHDTNPVNDFVFLLDEIENDPTGIFWG